MYPHIPPWQGGPRGAQASAAIMGLSCPVAPSLSAHLSLGGGGVGGSFSPLFFGFVSSKADRKEEGGEGGNLLPTALVSHASACYLGARNEDTQSTLPLLPSLEDEGR